MKKRTPGVAIWNGYLAGGWQKADGTWAPNQTLVPDALWGRVRHLVGLAGRLEEFKADSAALKERLDGREVEIVMFRTWIGKLGVEIPAGHYPGELLWPWSRGWTQEILDSYLWPDNGREAA